MLKNITLSAEDVLIQRAREKAQSEHTTLNAAFRQWLAQYARNSRSGSHYDALMVSWDYARPGRAFSRDEMNDR